MKIALGFRIVDGPWGGGNRFVRSLDEALRARGDIVVHDLADGDIDIILMLDPRWRHSAVSFTPGAILRYLAFRNPNALVVHRINECDERKGTRTLNARIRAANYCADHTVFVGTWLRDLPLWQADGDNSVILNGADPRVFRRDGHQRWDGKASLSLVTHHWGGNWMKGFDIYQRLDAMLADEAWRTKLRFTYIGNLPDGFRFRHASYLSPLDGERLAEELRRHDIYLTASINEPGGNHQNEGALCGLPLLYRRSGCLPEYCAGFGEPFDDTDFEHALDRMRDTFDTYYDRMKDYPRTSLQTTDQYLRLFDRLVASRESLVRTRRLTRNPWLLLRSQFPF